MGRRRCDICFQVRQCRQQCRTCRTNHLCTQCYTSCLAFNQLCPFCRQPYTVAVGATGTTGPHPAQPTQPNSTRATGATAAPVVPAPARLSEATLTSALDNLLPETTTPGTVMTFQNYSNRTSTIITSYRDPINNTPIGISLVSNTNGQVYEYLNTSNVRSMPQLHTIDVDEWNRVNSFAQNSSLF